MIRLYREQDTPEIIEAWYQASIIAHAFLSAEFLANETIELRETFLPHSQTWVDEREGQVVGFLSLLGNEVGGIFVHPNWQRKGVGQALMDKAQSLHPTLVLEVFEANKQGRAFYAKYGFEVVARFFDEPSDQMVLKLRHERPE